MFINYKKLPGFSRLFLDYVYNYEQVKNFYPFDFRKANNYPSLFYKVLKTRKVKNEEISEIIELQNKEYKLSPLTKRNIELLRQSNTIAVVTGQQVGIFSGPLYTIYKAITVIKLCESLKEKFDEFNFVPIFWMATDDHDFEEINNIEIIDKNNNLIDIIYEDNWTREFNRGYVGELKIKKNFLELFTNLKLMLSETEFTPLVLGKVEKIYSAGKTYASAFKEFMIWLFDKYGLIIFDPSDVNVKNLLKPVFKGELINFRSHADAIVMQSAILEENYHAQVKVKPINLFYSDGKGRRAIEPTENGFKIKRGKKNISLKEILELIDSKTNCFSPGVLLRPVCQDYLFPTGLYVAGPAEVAYFAQAMPIYKNFNVIPPVIYPRISATIIEKNVNKILRKFNLKFPDLILEEADFTKKVLQVFAEESADIIFSRTVENINLNFEKLKRKLIEIDPTLENSVEKALKKTLNNLDVLKEKTLKAQELKYQAAFRQIEKTKNLILPSGKLQERKLNILYFFNKYGLEVINWLMNLTEVNKFEHQILNDI